VQPSLAEHPETVSHDIPPQVAKRATTDSKTAIAGRYRIGAELARGGMGVVYLAEDILFEREIALKVLAPKLIGTPAATRFLAEARITGQLQHPGIPPVHEVGTLSDGRPFLAMKLIKGQTLAELLKARTNLVDDREKFEQVFEQICQTVAFAHARGVIHRDLKPQNIMVGAFGEVQVMDWGLAKDLHSTSASALDLQPISWDPQVQKAQLAADATQDGAVLGTPAYMPPEQARGEIDKLDARSDVFSLGAVLYTILTGRPPYTGSSSGVVWRKAAAADLDEAYSYLRESRAPHKLVLLCRRCLNPQPSVRPAHAGELAASVTLIRTFVEEFTRKSELDNAVAEAKAAERKSRNERKLGLYLGLFGMLLGIAVSYYAIVTIDERVDERVGNSGSAGPVAIYPNVPIMQSKPTPQTDPKPEPKPKSSERTPNLNAKAEADTLLRLTEAWLSAPNPDPLSHLVGKKKPLTESDRQVIAEIRRQYERLAVDLSGWDASSGWLTLCGLFGDAGETDEADVAWKIALAKFEKTSSTAPEVSATHDVVERIARRRLLTTADRDLLARCRSALQGYVQNKELSNYQRRTAAEAFEKMAHTWQSIKESNRASREWTSSAAIYADERLGDARSQHDAARCYLAAARLKHVDKDYDAAAELLEKVSRHNDPLLEKSENDRSYRLLKRDSLVLQAEVCIALKTHAAAAKAADELVIFNFEPMNDKFKATRVLAQCMKLVETDTTLSVTEQKNLASEYAEKAIKLLKHAIDRGYRDFKALSTDEAFAPLKDNQAFQLLLLDLELKSRPKSKK